MTWYLRTWRGDLLRNFLDCFFGTRFCILLLPRWRYSDLVLCFICLIADKIVLSYIGLTVPGCLLFSWFPSGNSG